jgi:hypothetical protein
VNFSDLIELHEAGLTIERIVISPDGSISVEFARVSKARRMAVSTISHKRVGPAPEDWTPQETCAFAQNGRA